MITSREFYIARARNLAARALECRRLGLYAEAVWCETQQRRVFQLMEFLVKG